MVEKVTVRSSDHIKIPAKPWALTGAKGREKNVIRSLWLTEDGVELNNISLQERYKKINETEVRFENYMTNDAEVVVVAYGASARIAKSAVTTAREKGFQAGLLRPITLYPFPYKEIERLVQAGVKKLFVVEMSAGQMVQDVQLAACGKAPIAFYGKMGGRYPEEEEVTKELIALFK
jgi:2-oxoglutarate ferredoxin oxidoreductase subunit alpha